MILQLPIDPAEGIQAPPTRELVAGALAGGECILDEPQRLLVLAPAPAHHALRPLEKELRQDAMGFFLGLLLGRVGGVALLPEKFRRAQK